MEKFLLCLRVFHRINFSIFIIIFLVVVLASCAKEEEYACTIGTGITMGCGNNTSYWCNELNGTWHKGKKCSDLGFNSAQLDSIGLDVWAELVFADSNQKLRGGAMSKIQCNLGS